MGINVVIVRRIICTDISVPALWIVREIFVLDQEYDLRIEKRNLISASYVGARFSQPESRLYGFLNYRVHPVTVASLIHPISEHVQHLLLYIWIAVVEIRLTRVKLMKIELLPLWVPRPSGTTKYADPIVGRQWIGAIEARRILPNIIVVILGVLQQGLLEPFVLVTRVVRDKVHENFQPC